MALMDPLIMELDREASATRRVLERVPTDKLDWRPHAKSTPIGKLANHIASLPGRFGPRLTESGFDVTKATPPPAPTSTEEILKTFDEGISTAKKALAAIDDGTAMGMWTLSAGDKTIASMPRVGIVRTLLLNHTVHHRGQLSVYLRLLDVPVPSIYGPSADENPFA
jgi:uncharacterized damage-inducible protein DinB